MLTYTKRTLRFPAVPRLAYDRNLLVPRSLLIARSRKIGPGLVPGLFFGRRFATARGAHVHKTYTALALPRLITALNRNPLMRSLIAHSKIEKNPGFGRGFLWDRIFRPYAAFRAGWQCSCTQYVHCVCSLKAHHRPEPEAVKPVVAAVLRRDGVQRCVRPAICDREARSCSDPAPSTPTEQSAGVARRWAAAAEVQRLRRALARSLLIARSIEPRLRPGFFCGRIFRPKVALRIGSQYPAVGAYLQANLLGQFQSPASRLLRCYR